MKINITSREGTKVYKNYTSIIYRKIVCGMGINRKNELERGNVIILKIKLTFLQHSYDLSIYCSHCIIDRVLNI